MRRLATLCVLSYLGFCSKVNGQGGVITTVVGNGNYGYLGDGGPAASGWLASPQGIAFDASGNLFIADTDNGLIRKVSAATGLITAVAGSPGAACGFSGDGGPATSACLAYPQGIFVDASGNLFIADTYNCRIRKVSAATGIITTVAGSGASSIGQVTANCGFAGDSGDGGPATSAVLNLPYEVFLDKAGNLWIADGGTTAEGVQEVGPATREVSAGSGIITTFAPSAAIVGMDASGSLFFSNGVQVRKLSASGVVTTVAGNGYAGFSGDGGPAISAELLYADSVASDSSGNVFISDSGNYRIRKVSVNGTITTFAGNGARGDGGGTFSGDGGPAASAGLSQPYAVAVDASGNLFIADTGNNRIREVTASTTLLPAPSINPGGVVPLDSTATTIQPGEWVSIYGTNLGPTLVWNGTFPTSLGGTSVTIDGKSAYLSYVSSGLINLQAPSDTATGTVPVVVTTATGSTTSAVTLGQFGPSFCLLDSKHVAGIILRTNGSGTQGGGIYDLIGPTGSSLGYPTVAAKAGDTVELFGVGFGPTSPNVPAGQGFYGAAPTINPVKLLINNVSVTPSFAGLSSAGLFQINLTVPAGLGTGDVPLVAMVGGVQTPSTVVISLR